MTRLIERVRELRRVTGGSTTCGWMTSPVAMLLYSLVKFHKPNLVIQTGTLWGFSSLVVLEAMTDGVVLDDQRQNADLAFEAFVDEHAPPISDPMLASIDPYPIQSGIDLLKTWYPRHFLFFNMTSAEFFRAYTEKYKRIMTIVDGDHSPEGCRADLEASARIGAKLIVLDDIDWLEHIDYAGRKFAKEHEYTYTPFYLYNGVAILTK